MKIKKGDTVKIIAGKDKGKNGKVAKVFADGKKIAVEGANLAKKHVRPRREGETGQRVEVPAKLDVSNVLIVCPKCGKAARVGYKIAGSNKSRMCKKCQSEI